LIRTFGVLLSLRLLPAPGSKVILTSTPWGGQHAFLPGPLEQGHGLADENVAAWHSAVVMSALARTDAALQSRSGTASRRSTCPCSRGRKKCVLSPKASDVRITFDPGRA